MVRLACQLDLRAWGYAISPLWNQRVAEMGELVLRDAQASLLGWSEDMSDDALEASFECLALARAQVRESAGIVFDRLDVAVNPKR